MRSFDAVARRVERFGDSTDMCRLVNANRAAREDCGFLRPVELRDA